MTKKEKLKIKIIIFIVFLVVCLVISTVIFFHCKELADLKSADSIGTSFTETYNFLNRKNDDEYQSIEELAYGIESYIYDKDCIKAFLITDANGKTVLRSGAYLTCGKYENNETKEEFVINLEKYFTKEIKQQIYNLYGYDSSSYLFWLNINYITICKKDDEVIPVELCICKTENDETVKELVIKLSDETAERKIYNSANYGTFNSDKSDGEKMGMDYREFRSLYPFRHEEKLREYYNEIIDRLDDTVNSEYFADTIPSAESKNNAYMFLRDVSKHARMEEAVFSFKGKTYCIVMICRSKGVYSEEMEPFYSMHIYFPVIFSFYVFLARAILSYLEKKRNLNLARQAFISAAAHELKTPISIIENQCEFIMENVAPEKNAEYINSIYEESLRMNKLVATLLNYTRLASADSVEKHKVSLSEIANEEVKKYIPFAEQKGVTLLSDIAENITVKANAELIALVIDNYLSNAVKNTEAGNKIEVRLNTLGLTVFNEGKPIDEKEGRNLWDVFYKEDKARTKNGDNSTGMGLAICKQILMLHKFQYGYKNMPGGVEFFFWIM